MFSRYSSLDFWFISTRVMPKTALVLGVIMLAMVISGILLYRYIKQNKKQIDRFSRELYKRIADLVSLMGSFGLVLVFFVYQGIHLLSMKVWFILWLFFVIIWALSIIRYNKTIAEKRLKIVRQKKYQKYLP